MTSAQPISRLDAHAGSLSALNEVLSEATENNAVPTLLHRGNHLYKMGDQTRGVYLIRAGAIKTYTISENGDQQILGFHLPGDIIGFDAFANGKSQCSAQALDTSSVNVVPFAQLIDASGAHAHELRRDVFRHISHHLCRDNQLLLLLAKKTAEQRLAWFLCQFSNHLRRRGLCALELTLPMSRTDIANYLGLAMETVCREFAKLKEREIVMFERRLVAVIDPEKLRELADGDAEVARHEAHQNRLLH